MIITGRELVKYINENPDKEFVVELIQKEENFTVNKRRNKRRVIIYEPESKPKRDL